MTESGAQNHPDGIPDSASQTENPVQETVLGDGNLTRENTPDGASDNGNRRRRNRNRRPARRQNRGDAAEEIPAETAAEITDPDSTADVEDLPGENGLSDTEDPVLTADAAPDAPTYAKARNYTETERDIIGREVYEAVTEERLEAAVSTASVTAEANAEADAAEDTADADPAGMAENGTAGQETAPEKVPVEVVGVRFKAAGKVYYFAPDGGVFHEGDAVIVETARGIEFGFVVGGNRTVMAADLVSPLKKVLRMANEEDRAHYEENNRRREEAFTICREKIAEHNIDMKLVDVEYTFDNNKLLFYFTADGRVDFRELVKDLASIFRTRIELRQIGIRDEAKLMGGLGVCGRPFCCHSFLSDFVQVSIKMAKEQNLSLNSAKISGTCGRLMCCLRYEYDVYEEELKKTPKMDAVVETPDGEGVVCEVIPLAGLIRVKFLGNRADVPPKLYHRDDVKVKGKMNWKSGNITYHDEPKA